MMQLTRRERIRVAFLAPAESYGLAEVACLTETPAGRLRREVRAGLRDASKVSGAWRFTWRQMAFLVMDRWSLAEIHEALGNEAAGILPPLLALRTVTVQLPEYLLRALETVATNGGLTLDACLYGELIDFAGTQASDMERVHPGYKRAYYFPGRV